MPCLCEINMLDRLCLCWCIVCVYFGKISPIECKRDHRCGIEVFWYRPWFWGSLGHRSLNGTAIAHRSSKYFNTLCRRDVTSDMSQYCKVRIGAEEMFCAFKHMVCRGPLARTFVLPILKSRFPSFLKMDVSTDMTLRDVESVAMMWTSSE